MDERQEVERKILEAQQKIANFEDVLTHHHIQADSEGINAIKDLLEYVSRDLREQKAKLQTMEVQKNDILQSNVESEASKSFI